MHIPNNCEKLGPFNCPPIVLLTRRNEVFSNDPNLNAKSRFSRFREVRTKYYFPKNKIFFRSGLNEREIWAPANRSAATSPNSTRGQVGDRRDQFHRNLHFAYLGFNYDLEATNKANSDAKLVRGIGVQTVFSCDWDENTISFIFCAPCDAARCHRGISVAGNEILNYVVR